MRRPAWNADASAVSSPSTARDGLRRALVAAALVGIAVFVAFAPALSARALWIDDDQYVSDNPLVQNPSWSAVGRFFGEVLRPSTVGGYYQPLAMTSLMLDWAAGGTAENPAAFRRTSLVLHALNAALVTLLGWRLFGRAVPAAFAGLLWGMHPLTVESTVWIAERKTLLATAFCLAALLAYVSYARTARRPAYFAALGCFVLALLSKPTITPLPLLLLVLDFWPLARLGRRTVIEKLPFFAIAGVSAVVTYFSQKLTATIVLPSGSTWAFFPLAACHSISLYVFKFVWPPNLAPLYPVPQPVAITQPAYGFGVLGTVLLTAIAAASLRWTRALAAGLMFFLIAVSPTLGLVRVAEVIASCKYAYFPIIGLLLPMGALLTYLWSGGTTTPFGRRGAIGALAALLLALECVESRVRIDDWRDRERLLLRAIALTPGVASLHADYGVLLNEKNRAADALAELSEALRLQPDLGDTHNNLGMVLARLNRTAEAMEHYQLAIRYRPERPKAYHNLGLILYAQGDLAQAAELYRRALELRPDYPDALSNLGIVLAQQGKLKEAEHLFRQAIRLRPRFVGAQANLGTCLLDQGRIAEAIEAFRKALAIQPEHPSAVRGLADAERASQASSRP